MSSENKIDKKIVSYKIINNNNNKEVIVTNTLEEMHENMIRPECLSGSTYKIKPPQAEHALYITVNDIILNIGTDNESRVPYEIFINSKNMIDFQWVLAFTRLISAVFRKGGNCSFLVEELKAIFDPKGGYWKKGGIYMPSVVAEIGYVLEHHLKQLGIIKIEEIDEHQRAYIEAKKKEIFGKENELKSDNEYPANAQLCVKCNVKAVVILDGCKTCLNCLDSKCG